ncbi:MAG: hypothetical protein PHF84_11450 [bacterium]|nr:hypothetical protein [bacterium]
MNLNNGKIFIYQFIIAPEKAIQYILESREDEHIGISLFTLFLSIVFSILSSSVISLKKSIIDVYMSIGFVTYFLNFLGNLVVFLSVVFFIKSFSLSTEQRIEFEKRNLPYLLFKLFCLSYLPYFFAPVLSLISLFLSTEAGISIYFLLKIFLWLWTVSLQVLIIRKVFRLKLMTSFILYILPLIGILAFVFIKVLNLAISFIALL